MDAVIILGNIEHIDKKLLENKLIIGVDSGAYLAYENNIMLDIAIGDFDSIDKNKLDKIKAYSKKTIILNSIKDTTDTNEAIKLCSNCDEILILGGIKGKRIEHFIANIIEIINDPRIKLLDDNSLILTTDKAFIPNSDYKYMSIFSISPKTNVTLINFKYELNNYELKYNDPLCISNEVLKNPRVLLDGRALVIYSKDDNNK